MIALPRPKLSPQFVAAAWELHRKQGGGYIPVKDIHALAKTIVILPPLRKLQPLLPPLPLVKK